MPEATPNMHLVKPTNPAQKVIDPFNREVLPPEGKLVDFNETTSEGETAGVWWGRREKNCKSVTIEKVAAKSAESVLAVSQTPSERAVVRGKGDPQ